LRDEVIFESRLENVVVCGTAHWRNPDGNVFVLYTARSPHG
jgi:hypothetical protein